MRPIILRLMLVLAAFTIVPNALAADTGGGQFFVDTKFGKTVGGQVNDNTGYSTSPQSAWGADGGYRWNLSDTRSLGVEVGYMHFGQFADTSDPMSFFSGQVSASAISLGANFQALFGKDKAWYVQARAGLTRIKFDQSYSSFPPGQSVTASSNSWSHSGTYVGLGVGRHITQSFSLMLALDGYSSGGGTQNQTGLDVDWLGLVAEYRF